MISNLNRRVTVGQDRERSTGPTDAKESKALAPFEGKEPFRYVRGVDDEASDVRKQGRDDGYWKGRRQTRWCLRR